MGKIKKVIPFIIGILVLAMAAGLIFFILTRGKDGKDSSKIMSECPFETNESDWTFYSNKNLF